MDKLQGTHTTYSIPIETSIEYERKKRDYDDAFHDDSGTVRGSVSQINIRPQESNVNQLFGAKVTEWGRYNAPEGFESQSDSLFGPQLTPSCTTERLDAASSRIQGKQSLLAKTATSNPNGEINSFENDANKIQSLLKTISTINKDLENCYGARAGFQKG